MTKWISKGKGRKKKSFPIKKKKGVSVRSVSLQPKAELVINKKQIQLINQGKPATFSKALNQVILRKKKEVPIYDTHVNTNERRKPYIMHVTDMKKHKKVRGSDTIVMADSYGQAIDDFITVWNKDPERKKMQIGYPVVQGTAMKQFRYKKDSTISKKLPKNVIKGAMQDLNGSFVDVVDYNPKWKLYEVYVGTDRYYFFPDEDSAVEFGRQSIRDTATEYIPDEGTEKYDEYKNLSGEDLVEKIIEEQSEYGQLSQLSAVAKHVAGYDGQYHELPEGWIAFHID